MKYRQVPVGAVLGKTDKAVHVQIAGAAVWVPLSVIDGYPPPVGRGGKMDVAEWFAEREDLPEVDVDEPDEGADPITVFACRRSTSATARRVKHTTFGLGAVVGVEGEKSVVRFDSGALRTILTRFLQDA